MIIGTESAWFGNQSSRSKICCQEQWKELATYHIKLVAEDWPVSVSTCQMQRPLVLPWSQSLHVGFLITSHHTHLIAQHMPRVRPVVLFALLTRMESDCETGMSSLSPPRWKGGLLSNWSIDSHSSEGGCSFVGQWLLRFTNMWPTELKRSHVERHVDECMAMSPSDFSHFWACSLSFSCMCMFDMYLKVSSGALWYLMQPWLFVAVKDASGLFLNRSSNGVDSWWRRCDMEFGDACFPCHSKPLFVDRKIWRNAQSISDWVFLNWDGLNWIVRKWLFTIHDHIFELIARTASRIDEWSAEGARESGQLEESVLCSWPPLITPHFLAVTALKKNPSSASSHTTRRYKQILQKILSIAILPF